MSFTNYSGLDTIIQGVPKQILPILWSGFTCSTWGAFMCHNVLYSKSRVQVLAHEGPSCASTWRAFMCHIVPYSESRWEILFLQITETPHLVINLYRKGTFFLHMKTLHVPALGACYQNMGHCGI